MYSVIDVRGPEPQGLRPIYRKRTEQRRRINSAAQGDENAHLGIARQKTRQTLRKPPRTELLCRDCYSGVSENTPNDAIRAERAARSSSRGMASS